MCVKENDWERFHFFGPTKSFGDTTSHQVFFGGGGDDNMEWEFFVKCISIWWKVQFLAWIESWAQKAQSPCLIFSPVSIMTKMGRFSKIGNFHGHTPLENVFGFCPNCCQIKSNCGDDVGVTWADPRCVKHHLAMGMFSINHHTRRDKKVSSFCLCCVGLDAFQLF